jgi:hypothetical protein
MGKVLVFLVFIIVLMYQPSLLLEKGDVLVFDGEAYEVVDHYSDTFTVLSGGEEIEMHVDDITERVSDSDRFVLRS